MSESSVFSRPQRWAQLAFVEDDPLTFDPDFWCGYFRETRVEGVCLSAGGCIAFYPTEVGGHYRSRWLGDGDIFGEMVRRCRAMGMTILARVDPHAIHDDLAREHPEYVQRHADGAMQRHWAHPEYWLTCRLGPYHWDFMMRVKAEIVERYEIDGIFSNRWASDHSRECARAGP